MHPSLELQHSMRSRLAIRLMVVELQQLPWGFEELIGSEKLNWQLDLVVPSWP